MLCRLQICKVSSYLASFIPTSREYLCYSAGKHGLFLRPQGSLPELELRYLQCTCCWRSRIPVAGFETLNATLSSSIPCEDDKSLDACYSPEQRAVILQLLNSATETELAGVKLLRGRKCHNIVEYRTRNGPFQNLESVINVPLLKHKSALIVFDSILNPQISQKKKVKIQLAKFIRPEVDKSWLVVRSLSLHRSIGPIYNLKLQLKY